MSENGNEFLGELRLGRRLTSWQQVAAGAMSVLAGLVFLLPIPLLRFDGPRAGTVVVLASLVLLLNLAGVMELVGSAGERGGTYTLVHEVLGGALSFVAGWGMLAGTVALGAVLIRATAEHITVLIPTLAVVPAAVVLAAIVLGLQVLRRLPRRQLLLPATVVVFALLAIMLMGAVQHMSGDIFFAPPSDVTRSELYAVAWLVTAYIVFEVILASRRLVRSPSALLPPAILAAFVTTVVSLLIITIVLVGLENAPDVTTPSAVVALLSDNNSVPAWAIALLAGIATIVAANRCLMTAVRQVNVLSLTGMLPEHLRRVGTYFEVPPLLFAVIGSITIPLIVWAPLDWLVETTAAFVLIVLITLNVAVIHSRRTEPDRRRLFEAPFHPLVPSVAIVVNVALLLVLFVSYTVLLGVGTWLLLGLLLYAGYGRTHQPTAQEGVSVFGRKKRSEHDGHEGEDIYRILLPIDRDHEQQQVLRLATGIAKQRNAELLPLQVIQVPDPLAIEQGRRLARERNTMFKWSTRLAVDTGVPTYPITRLAPRIAEGIVDTASEDDCELILLPWKIDEEEEQIVDILESVALRASCDVAVLAYRDDDEMPAVLEEDASGEATFKRILVPTAGGPHAPLAGRLAVSLAQTHGATITVLNVIAPDSSEEERAAAQDRIDNTISDLEEQYDGDLSQSNLTVEREVVEADSVVDGIAEASADHDLVLVGASEERIIEQVIFGDIPEDVARSSKAPVVIVKRYRGLRFTLQRRFWIWLSNTLPQLDGEAQIEVYRQLRRDSRPDVDFFVMIGLSAVIATFGLMQSSPAVIIGAMLVAPLFSPILGVSMAITRGDVRLLQLALESTLQGVALAIGVALAFVFLSPLQIMTPEIMARTEPSLFDLGVALASGAAGAYATARRDMSAALPGVAIAAALVPPLGVVGFGLATGNMTAAQGSILLVATNLIAIMLAGALVFLALGFRPGRSEEREARLRAGLLTIGVLVMLVSVYLATVFLGSIRTARARQLVQSYVTETDGIHLVDDTIQVMQKAEEVQIHATIYAERSISETELEQLNQQLEDVMGRSVQLSLRVILTERIGEPWEP